MDTLLKQQIHQLVNACGDIHQLTHIKLLLQSEKESSSSIVQEPAMEYPMASIKQFQQEIAALIDDEQDIDFLEDIKKELSPTPSDSDFEDLSPADREELLELIAEPFGKDCISHEEFLKTMARWDTK